MWRLTVYEALLGSSMGEEGMTSMGHFRVHLDHSAYSPSYSRDGCDVPRVRRPRGDGPTEERDGHVAGAHMPSPPPNPVPHLDENR